MNFYQATHVFLIHNESYQQIPEKNESYQLIHEIIENKREHKRYRYSYFTLLRSFTNAISLYA